MPKINILQTNFTNGEISLESLGRFDLVKYVNSVKKLENFLVGKLGGAAFRPGTVFAAEIKASANRGRLLKFQFSTTQNYVIEAGNLYFRYYTDNGQLISGVPVETVTPFTTANLSKIKWAQNADTQYMATGVYPVQKHQRTSATAFTLTEVAFVRGPFLDTNITAVTLTPTADTGAGITVASSGTPFLAGHVGSLWRIKDGVVKITAFGSTSSVTATVQAEPDGTAGDLNTGPAATTDWAEGAWSAVRGYPKAVTFHEGKIYYASSTFQPQHIWGSVSFAYENFDVGSAADSDAVTFQMNTDEVNAIRWIKSSSKDLQAGTSGGPFNIQGSNLLPISPANAPFIHRIGIYGAADIDARRMGRNLYYVQRDLNALRELGYFLDIDDNKVLDTNLFAEHILRDGSGAVEMDNQVFPQDRIWIVRNDGQIAVLTRNVDQDIQGWSRIVAGADATRGDGIFESVAIIPQEDGPDQIWVIVNRFIGGAIVRYVEYFTDESFDDDWDPVRLDSSLTLDSPQTIISASKADPVVIGITGHTFSDGDQIKIDNIVGMTELNTNIYLVANKTANDFELTSTDGDDIDGTAFTTYISGGEAREMVTALSGLTHLNGETVAVQVDGGLPAEAQTFTVAAGAITLPEKAAVSHVGLAYKGTLQLLKPGFEEQGRMMKIYLATIRLHRSLGLKIGLDEDNLSTIYFNTPNQPVGHAPPLFTGDQEKIPTNTWRKENEIILRQSDPLPLNILAIIMRAEYETKN